VAPWVHAAKVPTSPLIAFARISSALPDVVATKMKARSSGSLPRRASFGQKRAQRARVIFGVFTGFGLQVLGTEPGTNRARTVFGDFLGTADGHNPGIWGAWVTGHEWAQKSPRRWRA